MFLLCEYHFFLQVIAIFGAILLCVWFSCSWKMMPYCSQPWAFTQLHSQNPKHEKNPCIYWIPIPEFYNLWQFSLMFMECTGMNGPVNRKLYFWRGCWFVLHLYPELSTMEFKSTVKAFMCCGFENSNTTNDRNKPQRENLLQSAFRLEFPKPLLISFFPVLHLSNCNGIDYLYNAK